MRPRQTRRIQVVLRNPNLVAQGEHTDSSGAEISFRAFVPHQKRRWKTENAVGRRFGRLTVMAVLPSRNGNNGVYLRCACDCGGEATVRAKDLPNGNTVSCGCRRAELFAAGSAALKQAKLLKPKNSVRSALRAEFTARVHASAAQYGAVFDLKPLKAEFVARGVNPYTMRDWANTAKKTAWLPLMLHSAPAPAPLLTQPPKKKAEPDLRVQVTAQAGAAIALFGAKFRPRLVSARFKDCGVSRTTIYRWIADALRAARWKAAMQRHAHG